MKYFYWVSALLLAAALIYLVLVPAFAGRLSIPPEINLGSFAIRLYGITLALAILAGYLVARANSWRFGIAQNEVDDVAFWITIVAILGARIYYVVFDWSLYKSDFSEIYKIWHGGLSIYGGIIAGVIFILLYSRKKAYSVYQLLDLVALSIPLGQAIGRFGNFFNQEAFGTPTNLPWKMYISVLNRPLQYRSYSYFHPAFLYESLWDFLVFFVLLKFFRSKTKPGILTFAYLGMYSIGRFLIESIRLDSAYIGGLKVDQITAVAGLLVAGLFILKLTKSPKQV